jgi:arylsulfatase A-like enzyme
MKIKALSIFFLCASAIWAAPPNIIFILVDDMGWTGTSVQLDPSVPESKSDFYQTPNIEKLAKQGMRFSAAYAAGPMCTPSRAAILTGKTPAELHITTPGGGRAQSYQKLLSADFIREIPDSELTIAEALHTAGYATAHFGKWHLGRSNPGAHGFDVHDGSTANDGPGEYIDPNPKDVFGLTTRAIEFIKDQVAEERPFYLQISHYAVHTPVESLAVSKEKFAPLSSGKRHNNVEYAAMTWDLDTSIGTLLRKVSELNLTQTTYVIFMSDNGAPGNPRQSQNLPLAGGKGSLYEGGIRVPLIIRGPDIIANSYSDESVSACDLYPTICDWVGLAATDNLEGSSLMPLLQAQPETFRRKREGLLFHYPHYGQGPRQKPQSALILGNYKVIKDWENGSVQLYRLDTDISEAKDLAKLLPEKAAELETRLDERLKQLNAALPGENPNYDPNASQTRRQRRY